MEARKLLQARMLRLITLLGLVASPALGSQGAASREDAPIQARAEVVGSGEAGRAAGLIDLLVQRMAEESATGQAAVMQLDTEGIVRVTLLEATSPATGAEFSCATVLVEYLAN